MRNRTLVEDRLDGSSNFSSWKSRLRITLEEDYLLSMIQKVLPESATNEERQLASTADVDPNPPQKDEDKKDEAFFF
jgi:hypothetical protein